MSSAEQRAAGDDGRTRAKALRDEVAARDRRFVVLVPDGLVETRACAGFS